MLDTKLKKTHKLKNLIIALIVLIPALVLTCLYPQMERAMLDKKEQWHQEWEKSKEAYEKEQKETAIEVELMKSDIDEDVAVATEESAEELSVAKEFYLHDDFINYAIESS